MTEDNRAVRILRTIPDEPPAPSGIDIPRTMAEGRRRRRVRRWSGGVALAAVTAVAAGGGTVSVAALRDDPEPVVSAAPSAAAVPVPVPRDCTVKLLPTGDVKKAIVSGGDPSGHYLTGRVYPARLKSYSVIWKDGVLQPRPAMPGQEGAWGDINSAGVAVGYSFDEAERQQAYTSTGASVTRLPGGRAVASGIDEAGRIVGTLGDPDNGIPATWASPTAAPVRLTLPAGFVTGEGKGIDEDGTIVGTVARENGESTGYLWRPDGSGRLMPMPTVDGGQATLFWPESISNGWVYGRAVRDIIGRSGGRSFASYRYDIAAGRYEKLPIPLGPPAVGAANGWVLATTGDFKPVIIAGRKVVTLPGFTKMREYVTTTLSADGKTAGGYTTDTTATEPVANRPLMWTCR
ncbi:hypothetical protein ACGFJ7_25930 [Actinoplanes sp. NPDC048988]|uniref:hypothetical protein n=1 Tax=Actinoplanes sp. NPDC048988 TaxID=3363901 RepID=UPI0037112E4A